MRVKLTGTVMTNADAKFCRKLGWLSDCCCPDDVQQAIDKCPGDEELVFVINSGGGAAYIGAEIYNTIKNCGKNTVAEIYGIAGSAASVIAMGAKKTLMSPVSTMFIHRSAFRYTGGNAEKLGQDKQFLESLDEAMLNGYCEKAGEKASRTQLRHLMEKETNLTPEQAIELGLADGLIETPETEAESKGVDPNAAVAQAGVIDSGVFLERVLPDLDKIRAALTEQLDNTEPVEGQTGEGVQDNANEEVEGQMDKEQMQGAEAITTLDALKTAYPELVGQAQAEAATAERDRITGIEAMQLPGYEDIVAEAKADPNMTAAVVAQKIILKQKEQGAQALTGMRQDAQQSGANEVKAANQPEGKEESEEAKMIADAKEAVEALKEGGVL